MALDPFTLCLHINEKFIEVSYPGDEHIVLDNSGFHLECEEIKDLLRGHHWSNVSFETLEQLRSALPFLSPEGYHFYLPAFMTISIIDFSRADIIPDEIIRSLTLPDPSDIDKTQELAELYPELQPFSPDEWEELIKTITERYHNGDLEKKFFQYVSKFSFDQCKVIHEFLEYMRDTHGEDFPTQEPDIAIKRYWHRF